MKDPIYTTIESYELRAKEYITNTKMLAKFPELTKMLTEFLTLVPGNQILEIAFGSGRDTFYFVENQMKVTGVELTQAFVSYLHTRIDIPICLMDMRSLGFHTSTFDGIWCCSAFLHLPRIDALPTLREFARVLRPNGILYLDVKEGSGEGWHNDITGSITYADRYFTYYQQDEIKDLVRNAGFTIELAKTQKNIRSHDLKWLSIIGKKTYSSNSV